jgi:hypothetical protein
MLTEEQILTRATNIINNEIFCRAPHELLELVKENDVFSESLFYTPDLQEPNREDGEYFKEPLEFYLVSNWLGKNLKRYGEPAVELSTCYLWGRCTSGQYIIHDGTIQDIIKALNNEDQ